MKALNELLESFGFVGLFFILVIVAAFLASCARPPAPIVPQALLQCAPQPKSPADKAGVTQRDVALYVVDLAAAGDDCRSKLGSVRRILTPEK